MTLELTAEELRVLLACEATEQTIGSGSEQEWAAFQSLELRGLIAQNQLPENDFYWSTPLGDEALRLHRAKTGA